MGKNTKQTGAVSSYFSSNLLAGVGVGEVALVPNQLDVREQNSLLKLVSTVFSQKFKCNEPKETHSHTKCHRFHTLVFQYALLWPR